tara:strand:+ start:344 stop:481 length:138 start_codon:yes stop_codon:yes gene_type:complete
MKLKEAKQITGGPERAWPNKKKIKPQAASAKRQASSNKRLTIKAL